MDYKKEYEQAFERAKGIYDETIVPTPTAKGTCEYIFPKLKESEDERIRKSLIEHIKGITSWNYFLGISKEQMISWLEKQGEQSLEDKVNEAMREVEEKAKAFTAKHKGETTEEILAQMRGEQKPVDEVESMFKVGDWITRDGAIWRIEGVSGKEYILGGRPDVIIQEPIHIINSEFHLWTIQDAKDGDVLVWDYSKCITLFKNVVNKHAFESYFCIGSLTGEFEYGCHQHDIKGAHPATKEQRDLLFAKMKEAGYEWDAENKELREIEQNPAWSEEDKNCEKISEYTTVEKDMDEYNKSFECGKQRVLKYPEDFGLCEKPVWSEEDEKMLDAIIADIQFTQKAHTHEVNQVVYEREIDWLKSLYKDLKKLKGE